MLIKFNLFPERLLVLIVTLVAPSVGVSVTVVPSIVAVQFVNMHSLNASASTVLLVSITIVPKVPSVAQIVNV